MRLVLFGGTFDPIHRGHLAIASAAADAFGLDTVLFAPAGRQPLKLEGTPTPFSDRMAMVELACRSDVRFSASALDAPHEDGSANYTVDTIAALIRERPGDQIFMLAGADSFLDLPRWREPERLLRLAEWIVVSRPGFSLDEFKGLPLPAGRVHRLESVHEDVSATELREKLERGEDCSALVPGAVLEYVLSRGLYRGAGSGSEVH
ncbi:MAG: nicotinate (nicotinamide) nucleotide adenylyltransferase [Acidobacteriaceae bacterium]|nr:nicotinate (nicotinamide) nucleotide adenylyltransferase [Acidobacteriaceae bacterium]